MGSIINYCIIINIIIKPESAVQGRERVRALYQSEDPTPHNQHMEGRKKREQWKTKIKSRLGQQESIGSALKTLQSHTIKHRVTKIIPKRRREGTKVLRYWEVLQRGGANECLSATKAPRVTRAGIYCKGNAPVKGCIGLLLILNSMHNTSSDRRCYFKSTSHLSVCRLVLWG